MLWGWGKCKRIADKSGNAADAIVWRLHSWNVCKFGHSAWTFLCECVYTYARKVFSHCCNNWPKLSRVCCCLSILSFGWSNFPGWLFVFHVYISTLAQFHSIVQFSASSNQNFVLRFWWFGALSKLLVWTLCPFARSVNSIFLANLRGVLGKKRVLFCTLVFFCWANFTNIWVPAHLAGEPGSQSVPVRENRYFSQILTGKKEIGNKNQRLLRPVPTPFWHGHLSVMRLRQNGLVGQCRQERGSCSF